MWKKVCRLEEKKGTPLVVAVVTNLYSYLYTNQLWSHEANVYDVHDDDDDDDDDDVDDDHLPFTIGKGTD